MATASKSTVRRMTIMDAIIVGAGQSGLATAYYLHKAGIEFVMLDAHERAGGMWPNTWPSLTLFSPADASNLPGKFMPSYPGFPPASHVAEYLRDYEERYGFDILRPVHVDHVTHNGQLFTVHAGTRMWKAPAVVAATGTWNAPFVPYYPGSFAGTQWHARTYPGPSQFQGTKVAVVGGHDSGAQIAADLLNAGVETQWYTRREPRWLPDDVDGRVLFQRSRAQILGTSAPQRQFEGDIVMVPPVLKARDEGRLRARPMFESLDEIDAQHLVWATGFRPALKPFRHLLNKNSQPLVEGLHLVGYGNWTGPASATLAGVGPFAKKAAAEIAGRHRKTYA
ncbi:NAD(P)-binding domain-containing protein [Corynebacterium casei]|uniref:NAD(P)-binding domain-containing protein n=1 Tax=Corynebacterium casei TaxID=160386 RepID=UPI00264A4B22|nr:NAD(P)-binding domain-containing protein [Corynebacterium casei]